MALGQVPWKDYTRGQTEGRWSPSAISASIYSAMFRFCSGSYHAPHPVRISDFQLFSVKFKEQAVGRCSDLTELGSSAQSSTHLLSVGME